MTAIEGVQLPSGWVARREGDRYVEVISAPPIGCSVTVDFDARAFRGGLSISGPITRIRFAYSGRGWRQTLIRDAIAWLEDVLKS